MARKKAKGTELSVFKGREAKLNRAIFKILSNKRSLTIYDIYKIMKGFRELKNTHYGNLNKRVRSLERMGYLKKASIQNTKAGFAAYVYELTNKAHLCIAIDLLSLDDLIQRIDDESAKQILTVIEQFI